MSCITHDRRSSWPRLLTHDYFGRLDVIVNNAGCGQFGMVEEISEAQIRAQLETNLLGALWVTQAALSAYEPVRVQAAQARVRRAAPVDPSATRDAVLKLSDPSFAAARAVNPVWRHAPGHVRKDLSIRTDRGLPCRRPEPIRTRGGSNQLCSLPRRRQAAHGGFLPPVGVRGGASWCGLGWVGRGGRR